MNKIFVFGFGKYYAVSSYLICNRVTLTFPFLRQLSILEKKRYFFIEKDRCRRVCLLVLPLTTTSTPLTNLVFSLLRSSVSSANCLLTKVCWSLPIRRKYSIIIIIHEMTLDLTFSSLHAEPGTDAKFAISISCTIISSKVTRFYFNHGLDHTHESSLSLLYPFIRL